MSIEHDVFLVFQIHGKEFHIVKRERKKKNLLNRDQTSEKIEGLSF
jgi:hypothetical protein